MLSLATALALSLLVWIIHTLIVVVIVINSHYSFIYLANHTLAFLEFIDIALNHDEFILDISALYLRFHLLIAKISIGQSFLHSILLSILLEVNKSILHYVQILHFSHVVPAISLLLLDELGSF